MSALSAPVIVMRSFREGAGFARDARIDDRTLATIIDGIRPAFDQDPGYTFRQRLPDGRWILGQVETEHTCLDERAEGRRPIVIRAVLLPSELSEREEKAVQQALVALPLPNVGGPWESGLSVPLPQPILLPEPIPALSIRSRHMGALVVLLLLLGLEVWLQRQSDSGNNGIGWGIPVLDNPSSIWGLRVAGLLLALLLFRWADLPLARKQELEQVERALASGSRLHWNSLLEDDVWVLLPNGQRLTAQSLRSPNAAFLPVCICDPKYTEIRTYPGLAILQGLERITLGEEREEIWQFLRGYTCSHGRWRLQFAQWISTTQQAGADKLQPRFMADAQAAREAKA